MRKLLLLLFLPSILAATNGYQQIGWGAKSTGMGGVGVALPQDSFVAAMNPAGIFFVKNRVDVGLQARFLHANFRIRPFEGNAWEEKWTTRETLVRPEAGWAWGRNCWAVGMAAYEVGAFRVDYGEDLPKGQYDAYIVSRAGAWQINEYHTIGLSLNLGLSWLAFDRLDRLVDVETSDRVDMSVGGGLTVGWIGHLTRRWTIGVSYRSKTWMSSHKKYHHFICGHLDIPAMWGLGTAYCVSNTFRIAADLTRIMWADTRMWRQDQQRIGPYGAANGPGFGWKDQWVAKVGASWQACPWLTLRGGWNYGDIQAAGPEVIINTLTQSVIEHHFTVGATVHTGCGEWTIAYLHELFHNAAIFDRAIDRHYKLKTEQKVLQVGYGIRF